MLCFHGVTEAFWFVCGTFVCRKAYTCGQILLVSVPENVSNTPFFLKMREKKSIGLSLPNEAFQNNFFMKDDTKIRSFISIGLCDQERKELGLSLENLDFSYSSAPWLTEMGTSKIIVAVVNSVCTVLTESFTKLNFSFIDNNIFCKINLVQITKMVVGFQMVPIRPQNTPLFTLSLTQNELSNISVCFLLRFIYFYSTLMNFNRKC